jgi:hypothetical protein
MQSSSEALRFHVLLAVKSRLFCLIIGLSSAIAFKAAFA